MADRADRTDADQRLSVAPDADDGVGATGARFVELLVAAAVIALGLVILWQTGEIRDTPTAQVSARLFPRIIAVGTLVIGVWYAVEVVRSGNTAPAADADDVDPTLPTDWRCVGFVAAALVVYVLLIEPAGFIIASVALFLISAFGMGSRHYLRDTAIAILLATGVYYGFTEGLGVRLPAGVLEGVL